MLFDVMYMYIYVVMALIAWWPASKVLKAGPHNQKLGTTRLHVSTMVLGH